MIGRLRGKLIEIEGSCATLDVNGVGYEVLLPESVMVQLPPIGEEAELRIRQIFREDGVTLYGFSAAFERKLFDLLMDVKGCGPKIGLSLIGQLSAETVSNAIVQQDSRTLIRATGVGARLAERIILELKDKVQEVLLYNRAAPSRPTAAAWVSPVQDELVDALLALGYRRQEAEAAADQARDQAPTVEEQLVIALRGLKR